MSKLEKYLIFINQLNIPHEFLAILETNNHSSENMPSWNGIVSLSGVCKNHQLCDIDIRYAWGGEIFKQNLIDHGWSEATLRHQKIGAKPIRHKLIIYLCEDSTGLESSRSFDSVPNRYLIGNYWQTVSHLYLRLPLSHPFTLPECNNKKQLNDYATTRSLIQQKPVTANAPDDKVQTVMFLPPHPQRKGEGGLRTKGLFKSSQANKPLISVITIVFNGEKYIEQTIQSVINQSYENLEYIIVDGGSNDETLNIIRKYEEQIDYWVSEPDRGIYDAMNKGTLLASGSYTLHTNADDLLFQPNSLQLIRNDANHLRSVLIYDTNNEVMIKSPPKKVHENPYINIISVPVHHPGFIGLKTSNSVFDSSYKIIADSILIAEKLKTEEFVCCSDILAIYRTGGVSNENNFKILTEKRRVISQSKEMNVWRTFFQYEIYCRVRELAKIMGLVKLKRKIFG